MSATSRTTASLATVLVTLATLAAPAAAGKDPDRMAWWRNARFGMFIHWGLYAIPAGEWNGETGHAEWIRTTAQIPLEQYDEFVAQFNPLEFDADAWVRVAKAAGMQYVVITSKHHDGFCLFDSEHTEYDVMSTPFKRDIMRELAEACRRHGLRICWYHSIMDWHHPDYLPRRGWERATRAEAGANFDRYVAYLHGQVEELLTNYGDIGVMWFDGEWEGTWSHAYGQPLYDLCRRLQPDVIVNNRVDKGRGGMAGLTADAKYAGDFGTPEQEIPATGLPGVDWETCMTMNRHWGFNKSDHDWKSSGDLIRKLVDIASKGGNFLLNVGPTAAGELPAPSIERLLEMGAWLDANGEAIYGTRASPFASLPWGRCTVRSSTSLTKLYLHVFEWPEQELVVPGIGNRPVRAWMLTDPERPVPVGRDGADVWIDVPVRAPDRVCSVVVLEIAGAPVVYETPEIVAPSRVLVRPLAVELATRSAGLDLHYTLDGTPPTAASPRYRRPIRLTETTVVTAAAFHRGAVVSAVTTARFERVEPRPAAPVAALAPGLACDLYDGDWDTLPDFDALTPTERRVVPTFGLDPGPSVERVGRRYTGYLTVPRDDVYLVALASDDGSRLVIGEETVVDNDGLHGTQEKRGTIALAAGAHPIRVEWFNKTGGAELELRLAPVGETLAPVSAGALGHVP